MRLQLPPHTALQDSLPHGRCEVCHSPWTEGLAPEQCELWVRRGLLTNPNYRPLPDGVVDLPMQRMMLEAMAVGSLIVQSPFRAAHTGRQVNAAAHAMLGDARALSYFQPLPAPHHQVTALSPVVAQPLAASLVSDKGTVHGPWHLGCFLIVYQGLGLGSDGSHALVAVNLTRPRLPPPTSSSGPESVSVELAQRLRRASRGALHAVPVLDGGPCNKEEPLVLIAMRRGEELSADLDALQVDLDSEQAALTARCQWLLSMVQQRGDDDADNDADDDHDDDQVEGQGDAGDACGREGQTFFVASPAAAVKLACSGPLIGAVVVEGVAVWSTDQLLAETGRGGWGLCRAQSGDVPLPMPLPHGPRRVHELSGTSDECDIGQASCLWSTCWRRRRPLAVEEQNNPMAFTAVTSTTARGTWL